MKDIRKALRAYLLADTAIAAIISDRVYFIKMKQGNVDPCVVFSRISGAGDYYHGGPSGLAMPRYQIDSWSKTGDAATTLANLIKARLSGYRGVMGTGPAAVTVQGVFMVDEREDYDDTVQLSRMSRDYFIDHEEL